MSNMVADLSMYMESIGPKNSCRPAAAAAAAATDSATIFHICRPVSHDETFQVQSQSVCQVNQPKWSQNGRHSSRSVLFSSAFWSGASYLFSKQTDNNWLEL